MPKGDKDGNGVPDVIERLDKGAKQTTKTEFSYTVEGDHGAALRQLMERLLCENVTSRTDNAPSAQKPAAGFVSPLALEREREQEQEQTRRRTVRYVILGIALGFLAAFVLSRLGYL